MIQDANDETFGSVELRARVIIVGAGTMGLFLARSLGADAGPILLLECGDRVVDTGANAYTATSRGKPHRGVNHGRARGLGGTSALWGGQLVEFEDADFAGAHSWPLSPQELGRWYRATYETLGIAQPLPQSEYRRMLGNECAADLDIERFFSTWLSQPNFAKLFREQVASAPYISIILNATANDIQFEGGRARMLEGLTSRGRRFRIRGDVFVIAAGTIETCRFFLTTQRHSEVPWKTQRGIGRYFHDHLGGRVATVELTDEGKFREYFENAIVKGTKVQPKLRVAAPSRERMPLGVCGMFAFRSSVADNLAHVKDVLRGLRAGIEFSRAATLIRDVGAMRRSLVPLVIRYVKDKRIMAVFDQAIELHVQAEQWPVAESRIEVAGEERLRDGLYHVAVDWRVDGRELDSIRDFAIAADSYLQRRAIARLAIEPALLNRESSLLETLGDTYHQGGGMRMAANRSEGEVDSECRVWGTENVYVAGAAVFPTSGNANTTLTALALTARLAARLAT